MPWWDRFRLHKKRAKTHYDKLLFLQLVGSAGHVVHSGASRAQLIDVLFSCSGGTGSGSTKSALGHVIMELCSCIRWDLLVI
jgi:hypothetical protein